jgi:hypothetical protein
MFKIKYLGAAKVVIIFDNARGEEVKWKTIGGRV